MDGLGFAPRARVGAGQQAAAQQAQQQVHAQAGYLAGLRARLMAVRDVITHPTALVRRVVTTLGNPRMVIAPMVGLEVAALTIAPEIDAELAKILVGLGIATVGLVMTMPGHDGRSNVERLVSRWGGPPAFITRMVARTDEYLAALPQMALWDMPLMLATRLSPAIRQMIAAPQPPAPVVRIDLDAWLAMVRREPVRSTDWELLADCSREALVPSSLPNSPAQVRRIAAGVLGAALGQAVTDQTQARIFSDVAQMHENWPADEHLAFLRELLMAAVIDRPARVRHLMRMTCDLIRAHGSEPRLQAIARVGVACTSLTSSGLIANHRESERLLILPTSTARVIAGTILGCWVGLRTQYARIEDPSYELPPAVNFRRAPLHMIAWSIGDIGANALLQRPAPGETSEEAGLPAWLDMQTRLELLEAAWSLPRYLSPAQVGRELRVLEQVAADQTAPLDSDTLVHVFGLLMRYVERDQRTRIFEAALRMLQQRSAAASVSPWHGAAERMTSILQLYDAYLALAPLNPTSSVPDRREELKGYREFVRNEWTRMELLLPSSDKESKSGPRGDSRLSEERQIALLLRERLALFDEALDYALEGAPADVPAPPVERDDKAAFRPLQDLLRSPPADAPALRVGVRRVIEDQGGSALDAETLERDLGRIAVHTATYTPQQMAAVGLGLVDALGGRHMDASRWSGLLDAVFASTSPHTSAQRAGLLQGMLLAAGGEVPAPVHANILQCIKESSFTEAEREAMRAVLEQAPGLNQLQAVD